MNRTNRIALLLFFGALTFVGCNSMSDREKLVGVWHIQSLIFDGDSRTDGKDWFQFYEDGKVKSRTLSGEYDMGYWSLHKEKQAIYLKPTPQDSIGYDYEFAGDTLKLNTTLRLVHTLSIAMLPTDAPITDKLTETGTDWPAWPEQP